MGNRHGCRDEWIDRPDLANKAPGSFQFDFTKQPPIADIDPGWTPIGMPVAPPAPDTVTRISLRHKMDFSDGTYSFLSLNGETAPVNGIGLVSSKLGTCSEHSATGADSQPRKRYGVRAQRDRFDERFPILRSTSCHSQVKARKFSKICRIIFLWRKKGEFVFYASKNAGTITGVDAAPENYPEVPAMGQLTRLDDVGKSVLGCLERDE